jgi:hypothetical protein
VCFILARISRIALRKTESLELMGDTTQILCRRCDIIRIAGDNKAERWRMSSRISRLSRTGYTRINGCSR